MLTFHPRTQHSHEAGSSQQGGRQKTLILFEGAEHTQISPNSSNFAQLVLNIVCGQSFKGGGICGKTFSGGAAAPPRPPSASWV